MKKVFLVLLLMLPVSLAQQDFLNEESVVMNVQIASDISLEKEQNPRVDFVHADLFLYPKEDTRQKVLRQDISPTSRIENETIRFVWDQPAENELDYRINYDVEIFSQGAKVRKKVAFPLKSLPPDVAVFTQPTGNIDADHEEIIKLASEIVSGEDDLYMAVSKLATWVEHNIEYSLNTLTAEVSQKSSWVLLNRFGVCDELTSLFAAMARSLGIPVRFVSGLAYTNWQGLDNWGSHAWAEVYFPGVGWVPFDVTYRQLGFVDNSHITLQISPDSVKPSVEYTWLGYGFQPTFGELDIKTKLTRSSGSRGQDVVIDVSPLKSRIGFGSYNAIAIELRNVRDYYVTETLLLSKSKELEAETLTRFVPLNPGETKTIYWVVQLKPELDKKFIYTFPITVSTPKGVRSSTEFTSESTASPYTLADIDAVVSQRLDEEKKTYSNNVALDCFLDKDFFYRYEEPETTCTLKNTGNVFLENLNVCLKAECQEVDLGITQERELSFPLRGETGFQEQQVIAFNDQVSKSAEIVYELLEAPAVNITGVVFPEALSYNEGSEIRFTLQSNSKLDAVAVQLFHKNVKQQWRLNELTRQELVMQIRGKDLSFENEFSIVVTYADRNSKQYREEESFSLVLRDVTFFQKIIVFLRNIV